MWKQTLHVWPVWILAPIARINRLVPGGAAHDIGTNTQNDRDVHNLLDKFSPHIEFTAKEDAKVQVNLQLMGIPMGSKRTLYIFSPIWGKKYVHLYFNYCLKSLLRKENLESIKKIFDIKIIIYTNSENFELINRLINTTPIELRKYFEINIKCLDLMGANGTKYLKMDCAAHDIFKRVAFEKQLLFWVSPDTLYSKNALSSIIESHLSGGNIIYVPLTFRVHCKNFRFALKKLKSKNISISEMIEDGIDAHDLVKCAFQSINEDSLMLFASNYRGYRFPSHIIYYIGQNSWVCKGPLYAVFFDAKNLDPDNLNFDFKEKISLEASQLLDNLYSNDEVRVLTSGEIFFGAAIDYAETSVFYEENLKIIFNIYKSTQKRPNYFLISLFMFLPNFSERSYNYYKHNVVYKTESNSINEEEINNLIYLKYANQKMEEWQRFNVRYHIVSLLIYKTLICNKYISWLIFATIARKKISIKRLFYRQLNRFRTAFNIDH